MTAIRVNAPRAYIIYAHTVTSVALAGFISQDFTEVFAYTIDGYLKIGCDSGGEYYIYSSVENTTEPVEPADLLLHDLEVDNHFGLGSNSGLIVQRIVIVNSHRRCLGSSRRNTGLPVVAPRYSWADCIGEE